MISTTYQLESLNRQKEQDLKHAYSPTVTKQGLKYILPENKRVTYFADQQTLIFTFPTHQLVDDTWSLPSRLPGVPASERMGCKRPRRAHRKVYYHEWSSAHAFPFEVESEWWPSESELSHLINIATYVHDTRMSKAERHGIKTAAGAVCRTPAL